MNPDDKARLKNLRRRVNRARNFPENTCSASRHLHLIAERLAKGEQMVIDEPEHCAETMLAVLESLWKARTELDRIKGPTAELRGATND
jgi:hypothetical protein